MRQNILDVRGTSFQRKRLKTDRGGNEGKKGRGKKETEAEEGRKKEIELSVADQGLQGGKQRRAPVPILRFLW